MECVRGKAVTECSEIEKNGVAEMNLKPEELIKALRHCSNDYPCKTCPVELEKDESTCIGVLFKHCIDQIERDQKEISELREKQRWISAAEKEPEYDMPQLALTADGDVITANYAYGEWFDTWGQDVDVTHWMPLPEPPKEEP